MAIMCTERDHNQEEHITALIKAVDRISEKLVMCPTCVPLSGANMGVDAMLDISAVKHMARQIREEEAENILQRRMQETLAGGVVYDTTLRGPDEGEQKKEL
jgi:hypothetical protein